MESFQQLFIIDLQGNKARRDNTDTVDDNLFDIRTGVCLTIAVKDAALEPLVLHTDVVGSREAKLKALNQGDLGSIGFQAIQPAAPLFSFSSKSVPTAPQYENGWSLDRIFRRYVSEVQTKRDDTFVARSKEQLIEQVKDLFQTNQAELPSWLHSRVSRATFNERFIQPYLVAPFDVRWVYYDPALIGRARYNVLQHLMDGDENLAFIFMRQSTNGGDYDHFLVTRYLASDRCFYSAQGAPFLAPLRIDGESNVAPEFCAAIRQRLSAARVSSSSVFEYIVGITGSEEYRRLYAAQLGQDFPRLPLPVDQTEFELHAERGKRLIEIQANIQPPLIESSTQPQQRRNAFPTHQDNRVLINDKQSLDHVSAEVWQLTIGGYRVLQRWLKQRSNHLLTASEMSYAQDLVTSLEEVVREVKEDARPTDHIQARSASE